MVLTSTDGASLCGHRVAAALTFVLLINHSRSPRCRSAPRRARPERRSASANGYGIVVSGSVGEARPRARPQLACVQPRECRGSRRKDQMCHRWR